MQNRWFWLFFAGMSALIGTLANTAEAQASVIKITLPFFWEQLISEEFFADFEAAHNVDVEIEFSQAQFGEAPLTTDDIEAYVATLTDYFNSADVIYAQSSWLRPEVSRAGFTVDLMPLVSSDSALNPNDFYPVAWQSFQWDGGMWALPISVSPLMIDYNVEAFDALGLAYPTAAWTIDEFANAARTLTEYDESGEVVLPAVIIDNNSLPILLRALSGQGFYDGGYPDMPNLDSPELASILETWNELLTEGVVSSSFGNFERFMDVPIQIGGGGNRVTIAVAASGSDDEDDEGPGRGPQFNFEEEQAQRAYAPLPNGLNAVSATGFAVSAGSSNPMLAYELARFMSESQAVADASFGAENARSSYPNTETELGGGAFAIGGTSYTPEEQAMLDDVLNNGLPASEMRFSQYLRPALENLTNGDTGIIALQAAELDAIAVVEAMDALDVALTVVVDEPVVLAAGEIELTFSYQSFVQPLPNEDEWDSLIADFVAQDSQVGAIEMEVTGGRFGNSGADSETYDCAYYPSTQFIDIDPELLFALDPLIFSDSTYNVNDLASGALAVVQVEGVSYGLPITIQPSMLQYNPDSFAEAGLNEPIGGWTVSEFADALEALTFVVEEDETPFVSMGFGSQYLLMFIAAQGGLPIDYRTNPPTINFTSPETVTAIQAVLDWAKAGYFDYQGLGDTAGGVFISINESNAAPISATFFGGFTMSDVSMTTYPTGSYIPTSFDVGAGYVNKTSAYPEACYRWLSYLATHSYAITGSMPALLSSLNDSAVQGSLNPETLAAYQTMAELMSAPNMVNFNESDPFVTTWLNRAFDTYVLEDGDLLTALQEAEQPTRDYLACTANLELSILNFEAIQDCVTTADSGL